MKCPKCGYTSHDYLDECRKCHHPLGEVRTLLNLTILRPPQAKPIGDTTMSILESTVEAENLVDLPDNAAASITPATASEGLSTTGLETTTDFKIPPPPTDTAASPATSSPPLESLGTMDMLDGDARGRGAPPSPERGAPEPTMETGPGLETDKPDSVSATGMGLDLGLDADRSLGLAPETGGRKEFGLEQELQLAANGKTDEISTDEIFGEKLNLSDADIDQLGLELEGIKIPAAGALGDEDAAATQMDSDEQLLGLELDLDNDEELLKLLAETDPDNNQDNSD
jgi:hypothetical protein